ncbi:MAG TPA: rhodanese-like domain-containing protein [Vicinamibacterales bacterium]|nr:rhodanese-like domain-containing protein [Vicinamibacterales bacterium]
MRTFVTVFAVSVTFLVAIPSAAGAQSLLVSTAQLADRLNDPKLVILHVGEKAGYDTAHVPGARFADVRTGLHTREQDLNLQMLPPDVLRERLAALGISDDSHIVIYQAGGWFTPATRLMLTLHWAGLDNVALLDGGLEAWTRETRPVTAEVPAQQVGVLSPLKVRPVVADAEFVQAHLGRAGFAIVDARTSAFYDGTQTGGNAANPHKTGHIAGALSLPFSTVTTGDGLMKSPEELRALFTAAGVKPDDTVVTYCHIGQQATGVLFAARLLGHRVVLYDGSFEDWSRRNLPVDVKR